MRRWDFNFHWEIMRTPHWQCQYRPQRGTIYLHPEVTRQHFLSLLQGEYQRQPSKKQELCLPFSKSKFSLTTGLVEDIWGIITRNFPLQSKWCHQKPNREPELSSKLSYNEASSPTGVPTEPKAGKSITTPLEVTRQYTLSLQSNVRYLIKSKISCLIIYIYIYNHSTCQDQKNINLNVKR